MDAIIEERYFKWLYSHISDPTETAPYRTYWKLARQLHKTSFIDIVANDDNRCVDGQDLRREFLRHFDGGVTSSGWMGLDCSMLEMLVALSHRLEFQTDEPARQWFWQLLGNIYIADFTDQHYEDNARQIIGEALDTVIWRTYSYSGEGGLFPLQRADRDQRKLEIWFQMHSYLLEGF